jgi:predicted MFS family arabinose efflux permease
LSVPFAADELPRTPAPANAEALELASGAGPFDPAPSVAGAAILVGTVALMILGVQPVLLEALARAGRITEAQAGPLATLEDVALAVGAAIGPRLMRSGRMRAKVVAVGLVLALVDLAIFAAHSFPALALVRGAAGLFEGLMLGATLVVLIQHSKPDRMNALFLGLSTLPQAALAFALPAWITPAFGVDGGFAALALLAVAGVAGAPLLLDRVPAAKAEGQAERVWNLRTGGGLAAVAFQNAAIGAAWSYLPLLFDHRGFPATLAGVATSGGLVFQVVGAFAVAAWGGRLSHRAAVVVGSLLQLGVILGLVAVSAPAPSVALSLAFGLFWLAVQPFQVRLLIEFDTTRTAAMMLSAVTLLGLSLGPAVSALAVRGADVTGAFWVAGAMMAAAALLYILLAFARRGDGSRERLRIG